MKAFRAEIGGFDDIIIKRESAGKARAAIVAAARDAGYRSINFPCVRVTRAPMYDKATLPAHGVDHNFAHEYPPRRGEG